MLVDLDKQSDNASVRYQWSNRETYLADLWLTNDIAFYNYLVHLMKEPGSVSKKATELEGMMRELLLDELASDVSLQTDLMNASMERIKWVEIINNNR